ncbi:MAG: hypothetical protein P4M08_00475 [Oligoflexia bacterium]|nr:hypothetical protein [Oligoflexia bacterium]
MTKISSRFLLALLAVAFCFAEAENNSWAYVPPAGFLVKTLAKKHTGYKRIRIKSEIVALDKTGQPTGSRFRELLIYTPSTGILRSTASDEAGTPVYESTKSERSASVAARLLLESRSASLVEALRAIGLKIPTESELEKMATEDERRAAENEHMGRLDHSIAFVVGPADGAKSELWFDKEAFLPIRLVGAFRKGDSSINDIRYSGFRNYNEFPYPKNVIWMTATGTPVLRAEAIEVGAESGSNPAAEREHTPQHVGEGWTDKGQSADSGLKDLIGSYYSILR